MSVVEITLKTNMIVVELTLLNTCERSRDHTLKKYERSRDHTFKNNMSVVEITLEKTYLKSYHIEKMSLVEITRLKAYERSRDHSFKKMSVVEITL